MATYQDMEGNWIRTDVTIQEMQEQITRLTAEVEKANDAYLGIKDDYTAARQSWRKSYETEIATLQRNLQSAGRQLAEAEEKLEGEVFQHAETIRSYEEEMAISHGLADEVNKAKVRCRELEKTAIDGLDAIAAALGLGDEFVLLSDVLAEINNIFVLLSELRAKLAAVKEESAETCRKLLEDNHRIEVQLADARGHIEYLNAWLIKHHGTCDPDALRAWGQIHAAIDAGKGE
jgi:chromosome segregation ATPase